MANESKPVYKGKVTLGANTVLGMGKWQHSGLSREVLDDTEFGDEVSRYLHGNLEGGTVTFAGMYKKDDTTGQDTLRSALMNSSAIGNLRLYVDATSYYTPNNTTAAGGGVPAGFPISYFLVTSIETDFSGPKGALGQISFAGQVDGVLRLI